MAFGCDPYLVCLSPKSDSGLEVVNRFQADPELPGQNQLAISHSEAASDSLPSLRAGVGGKEYSSPVPESAAFGSYSKPLPYTFIF